MTSWPTTRQVLVPAAWQQLPGLSAQRPVQQHLIPDTLTTQQLTDPIHRPIVLDNLDQASAMFPVDLGDGRLYERMVDRRHLPQSQFTKVLLPSISRLNHSSPPLSA